MSKENEDDRGPFFWAMTLFSFCWASWGFYELKINWCKDIEHIGAFLAGWFAPLAFFWFVYAVFLQRKDLNLNTKALEAQLGELKISNDAYMSQVDEMVKNNNIHVTNRLLETIDVLVFNEEHKSDLNEIYANIQVYYYDWLSKQAKTENYYYEHFSIFYEETKSVEITMSNLFNTMNWIYTKLDTFRRHLLVLVTIHSENLQNHSLIKMTIADENWKRLNAFYQCHRLYELNPEFKKTFDDYMIKKRIKIREEVIQNSRSSKPFDDN